MGKSYHPNEQMNAKYATDTLRGSSEPSIDWHKKECLQMALSAFSTSDPAYTIEVAQMFYEFMKVNNGSAKAEAETKA